MCLLGLVSALPDWPFLFLEHATLILCKSASLSCIVFRLCSNATCTLPTLTPPPSINYLFSSSLKFPLPCFTFLDNTYYDLMLNCYICFCLFVVSPRLEVKPMKTDTWPTRVCSAHHRSLVGIRSVPFSCWVSSSS